MFYEYWIAKRQSMGIQVLTILSVSVLVASNKLKPCEQGELFPHESNYASFYMCNKGKRVPVSCPYGLYFSQNSEGCDYLSEDFLLRVKPKHQQFRPSKFSSKHIRPDIKSASHKAKKESSKLKFAKSRKFYLKSKLKLRNNVTSQMRPRKKVSRTSIRPKAQKFLYADDDVYTTPNIDRRKLLLKTKMNLKTTPAVDLEINQYLKPLVSSIAVYPDYQILYPLTTQKIIRNASEKRTIKLHIKKKKKPKEPEKKHPKLKLAKTQKFHAVKKKTQAEKSGLDLKIYPDYEMYLNVVITKRPKAVTKSKPYMNIKEKAKLSMQRKLRKSKMVSEQYLDFDPDFEENTIRNRTWKPKKKKQARKNKNKKSKILKTLPNTTPNVFKVLVHTVEPSTAYSIHIDDRHHQNANYTHGLREIKSYNMQSSESSLADIEKELAYMESDRDNLTYQSLESDI